MSKKPRLSHVERERARDLIKEMRVWGFEAEEIEALVGGKWKRSTIRKYCRGVEVKDTSQKDAALEVMRRFAERGEDWSEIKYYVNVKTRLDGANTDIEAVLKVVEKSEHYHLDVKDFGDFYAYLEDKGYTTGAQALSLIDQVKQLLELGIKGPDFENLLKITGIFGDFQSFLQAMEVQANIFLLNMRRGSLEQRVKQYENLIDESKVRQEKLLADYIIYTSYIEIVLNLVEDYHFDLNSFKVILETAKKYGHPVNVLEAVNKYENLEVIKSLYAAKLELLKDIEHKLLATDASLKVREEQLEKINIGIGGVEERYKKSRRLQQVSELLDDPSRSDIEPREFLLLSLAILSSLKDYGFTHQESLGGWSRYVQPEIDSTYKNINNVIAGRL